jgi:hypothetical protein
MEIQLVHKNVQTAQSVILSVLVGEAPKEYQALMQMDAGPEAGKLFVHAGG